MTGLATLGTLGLAVYIDRFGRTDRSCASGAIVVLGAHVDAGGRASPALRARAEHGARLFQKGLAPLLIFSGGVGHHAPSEAEVGFAIARALGGPPEACLLESASHSTFENARFTARLLRERGVREALVVSDSYHLFRARQYFRRERIDARPSPVPRHEHVLTFLERAFWTLREVAALFAHPGLLVVRNPACGEAKPGP